MRSFFLVSCVVTMLAASPAAAQDAGPPPTTESVSTNSFRGIRIEGNVGGDRFMSEGVHNDKLGYGGTIGFDGTIGDHFVVGPEGSYWRANDWTENCTPGTIGGTQCHKSFQEYGVAVRGGVLVTPQFLVFGKGGYVNNEQRKRFTAPAGQTGYYDHFASDGYQLGGGVEYSAGDRFSGALSGLYLSGQYVYSNYSDHTSRQRLMLGVGVRFK